MDCRFRWFFDVSRLKLIGIVLLEKRYVEDRMYLHRSWEGKAESGFADGICDCEWGKSFVIQLVGRSGGFDEPSKKPDFVSYLEVRSLAAFLVRPECVLLESLADVVFAGLMDLLQVLKSLAGGRNRNILDVD